MMAPLLHNTPQGGIVIQTCLDVKERPQLTNRLLQVILWYTLLGMLMHLYIFSIGR